MMIKKNMKFSKLLLLSGALVVAFSFSAQAVGHEDDDDIFYRDPSIAPSSREPFWDSKEDEDYKFHEIFDKHGRRPAHPQYGNSLSDSMLSVLKKGEKFSTGIKEFSNKPEDNANPKVRVDRWGRFPAHPSYGNPLSDLELNPYSYSITPLLELPLLDDRPVGPPQKSRD